MARGPEPKTSAVVDHGTPGQWHGAKAQTTIACKTDDEVRLPFVKLKLASTQNTKVGVLYQVLQGLLNSIDGHDFTIGRFMELSHTLGCSFSFFFRVAYVKLTLLSIEL